MQPVPEEEPSTISEAALATWEQLGPFNLSSGWESHQLLPGIDPTMEIGERPHYEGCSWDYVGQLNRHSQGEGIGGTASHGGFLIEGFHKDGTPDGYARWLLSNGDYDEGGWERGRKEEAGGFGLAEGGVKRGVWRDGKFQENPRSHPTMTANESWLAHHTKEDENWVAHDSKEDKNCSLNQESNSKGRTESTTNNCSN